MRRLGPGEQVDRGQRADQPRLVDVELAGGESADEGAVPAADPVLDAGMRSVPDTEPVMLPGRRGGRARGVAVAVGIFGTGRAARWGGAVRGGRDLHPSQVAGREQAGEFGDVRTVTGIGAGLDRGGPGGGG